MYFGKNNNKKGMYFGKKNLTTPILTARSNSWDQVNLGKRARGPMPGQIAGPRI